MGVVMYKFVTLVACGFIGACAGGYNPAYFFNEVQVVNLAGAGIRNVSLRITNFPKY